MPSVNYAVRLRTSYETLKTTVADWALLSEKLLCYEHNDKKENVHCHFLLYGVYDSVDTLKRKMRSHGIDLKGSGQLSFKTSFKLKDGTKVDITDETIPKYVTYMSKGKYDPSYNKGYDPEFIAACKAAWINHPKSTRDEALLVDFTKYIDEVQEPKRVEARAEGRTAQWLHRCAVIFCVFKMNGVLNVQTRKDIDMVRDSYGLINDIVSYGDVKTPYKFK